MTAKTVEPQAEFDPKTNIESWEITTEGIVWVFIRDPREVNGYRKQMIGGRQGGVRRIHISTDDRRFNQEQVAYGNEGLDPFRNGTLIKVDETHVDDVDTTNHLTMDQLVEFFDEKNDAKFQKRISDIKSELILRRLLALAEQHGRVSQLNFLRALVLERYPIGGTQKTVREMIAANELAGGEVLTS